MMTLIIFAITQNLKNMLVPFNDLSRRVHRSHEEIRAILERVVLSGRYVLGAEVRLFEEAFAGYVGTKYAIGVNSGTDALSLSLRALDVSHGDEVITVANTAVPTVAAIRMAGGVPVFADIDASYVMDPIDLKRRITAKTKVILPVHLYGLPADMKAINAIAKEHNIKVVEDVAQAHGATIGGVQVGNFSDIAAFSFYPTKNLGAFGDGGAVVTNSQEHAERVKRIRMYGEEGKYNSVEEGVNSRLDEIQAAFLSYALGGLSALNMRRKEIALRYLAEIKNPYVTLPAQQIGEREGAWHLFVVQVERREHFMQYMQEAGIECAVHYPLPIYRQHAYSFMNVDPGQYPVTERISSRIVSLPSFPELTAQEQGEVVSAVNAYGG